MTIFKTYLKILNKNKIIVILYTIILIGFAAFNMQNNDMTNSFTATKPDILIINEDESQGITQDFIKYLTNHANIKPIKSKEEARKDALFYRDINYIIHIPTNFRKDFLKGNIKTIQVESTGDYQASLAQILVEKYLNTASIYQNLTKDEEQTILKTNQTLAKEVEINLTTKLPTTNLTKAIFFYNFTNYSILAGCVFIICFIISTFKQDPVRKRTIISSTSIKKYNRQLLLSNSLFAFTLWALYVLLSFLLIGNVMITLNGLILILNSFIFTITALALAILIGNVMRDKEAISGIVNVIALGSSFLCGAFVPAEFLPSIVLKIAHMLPSYYYINTNNTVKTLETWNLETLKPILSNTIILLGFSILFIIISNQITKRQRKIG